MPKVVRGFSNVLRVSFALSYSTDAYRSSLGSAQPRPGNLKLAAKRLPEGRHADAMAGAGRGVGWSMSPDVVLGAPAQTLAELRSVQGLAGALSARHRKGVAEVASIGVFERQYQVIVDPRSCKPSAFRLIVSAMLSAPASGFAAVRSR